MSDIESSLTPLTDSGVDPEALWTRSIGGLENEGALSHMLLTALERRYLSSLDPDQWIWNTAEPGPRPLVRKVQRLGRPTTDPRAFAQVLASCHRPGHAFTLYLHGREGGSDLYLGTCRRAGRAEGSTLDHLRGAESAFLSLHPGLSFDRGPQPLSETETPALASLIQSAPAATVITGIPVSSLRADAEGAGLERVVEAVGSHQYVIAIVADPVEPEILEATIDRCRHLKSEIHTLARRSLSHSRGSSTGRSTRETTEPSPSNTAPILLTAMGTFLQSVRRVPYIGWLAPLGEVMQGAAAISTLVDRQQASQAGAQLSSGSTEGHSVNLDVLDANAEACETALDQYVARLQAARASGAWQTSVLVLAENEAALHAVSGAVRSLGAGEQPHGEPVRAVRVPINVVRNAALCARPIALRPRGTAEGHPLGPTFDSLSSCLGSSELATWTRFPSREVPGLPTRDRPPFSVALGSPPGPVVSLGPALDGADRPVDDVVLNGDSLNRHVFITGMTGFGKSNTARHLLHSAWTELDVPFLVIEPAKTEYRGLKSLGAFRDDLRVFTLASGPSQSKDERTLGPTLRLNPFAPVEGFPLGRHVDLLKAVFNASFPMGMGMTYLLEEAIFQVYSDRGWSLFKSVNSALPSEPSRDEKEALLPTLSDLEKAVRSVVEGRRYAGEVSQNLTAALQNRVGSLRRGLKGMVLDSTRTTPDADLFRRPAVVELSGLEDDDEKAFVMALLLVRLYEYGETHLRGKQRDTLHHVTLIEEAHRLLSATGTASSGESADPRAKAVGMFVNLLAEMRSLGEGFIIADQVPVRLAPETLKNTNVKIVHRLVAPDDRAALGGTMNLGASQTAYLGTMPPGQAVVHDSALESPVLVQVPLMPMGNGEPSEARLADLSVGVRESLRRHGGCYACPSPCSFYDGSPDSSTAVEQNLSDCFECLYRPGYGLKAWESWQTWRSGRSDGDAFCAAANGLHAWCLDVFSSAPRRVERPRRILGAHQLARTLSPWLHEWAFMCDTADRAVTAFHQAQSDYLDGTSVLREHVSFEAIGDKSQWPLFVEEVAVRRAGGNRDAPTFRAADTLLTGGKPVSEALETFLSQVETESGLSVPSDVARWAICEVRRARTGTAHSQSRRQEAERLLRDGQPAERASAGGNSDHDKGAVSEPE